MQTSEWIAVGALAVVASAVGHTSGVLVARALAASDAEAASQAARAAELEAPTAGGKRCASGATVRWASGRERCATAAEAEVQRVCPDGRLSRDAAGIHCAWDVEP